MVVAPLTNEALFTPLTKGGLRGVIYHTTNHIKFPSKLEGVGVVVSVSFINSVTNHQPQSTKHKEYKMRVTFNNDIQTKSGKCKLTGQSVFKSRENDTVCIQRKFTYPRITDHNKDRGAIFQAATKLWQYVSPAFKEDLKAYARSYNLEHRGRKKLSSNAFNIFLSATCKVGHPLTSMDDLIFDMGSTIEYWIKNGYLKPINSRIRFVNHIEG